MPKPIMAYIKGFMTQREVAQILNMTDNQLAYRIHLGALPPPDKEMGKMKLFSQDWVRQAREILGG